MDCVNDDDNEERHKKKQKKQQKLGVLKRFNIAIPVHLYGGVMLPGQSLGNRIGAMVARVPGEEDADGTTITSVDRLERVHDTLHDLKKTPTPLLSYLLVRLISSTSGYLLPSKWTQYMFSKANAGAVAVVTNVQGPPTKIHVGGRRIESMHGFVPLPPGVPIGVVVGSYAGDMHMSLSAEPWAVPDGDQFLVWVLEEYQSLLKQAQQKASQGGK